MNQKGMMLKMVTTMLLALLIFLPACAMVSRIFRISEQAENSFRDFVAELHSFFNNEDLENAFVLKMDPGTAVVGFTRNSPVYVGSRLNTFNDKGYSSESWESEVSHVLSADTSRSGTPPERYFGVPQECTGFPCICLCQQFEPGAESTLIVENVQLSRTELSCRQLTCKMVSDFSLKNDFVILREDQQAPRRVTVHLTREAGGVVVKT